MTPSQDFGFYIDIVRRWNVTNQDAPAVPSAVCHTYETGRKALVFSASS